MSDQKPPAVVRVPLNLRISPTGRDMLDNIAAARTKATGKKVTRSAVARAALADYCTRNATEARG